MIADSFTYSFVFVFAVVAAVAVFVITVWALVMIAALAIRMTREIKSEVSLVSDLWLNPFNAIYQPRMLTAEGLRLRRRIFLWVAVLLACGVIFWVDTLIFAYIDSLVEG